MRTGCPGPIRLTQTAALLAAVTVLACGHFPSARVRDRFPAGRWVVTGFALADDVGPGRDSAPGHRALRKVVELGPDRFGSPDLALDTCAPGPLALDARRLSLEDAFDARIPGHFSLRELKPADGTWFEVRNRCGYRLYLSPDRTRLFFIQGGLLLELEPTGRAHFEPEPGPEPVPTPAVEKLDFGPGAGKDWRKD